MHTVCFENSMGKIVSTMALKPVWPGVIYSPLSPTHLKDVPEKPLPGPNWVRVRNLMSGICGTDLHLVGLEFDTKNTFTAYPMPSRSYYGHEVVSVVTEIGPSVKTLKVGDRVIMDSRTAMHATCLSQELDQPCQHCRAGNYQLCENGFLGKGPAGIGAGWGESYTAHASEVYRVPDGIDDETAVLIEPFSIGVHAALRKLPKPGDQVLVVGGGTIGLTVLQAVRALSPECHITVMARYPQQIALARSLGADEVIADGDPYAGVMRITHAKMYTAAADKANRTLVGGFDVVFDSVGSAQTIKDSLRWARGGGAVVLVGLTMQQVPVDLTSIIGQEVELIGTLCHGMEEWNGQHIPTYDLTCDLLLQGKLKPDGLITHTFRIEKWKDAVRTAGNKKSGSIKVVFDHRQGNAA